MRRRRKGREAGTGRVFQSISPEATWGEWGPAPSPKVTVLFPADFSF